MEPNFQTSFIPKKPIVEDRVITSHPVGITMIASLFILFAIILATGGLYFYQGTLAKGLTAMKANFKLAQNGFEPAKLKELQVLDKRLNASSEILKNHIAISPIFKALQDITLKTIRYTQFTYSFSDDPSGKVSIKMKGVAIGYRSVALQSDLFTKNNNIIDPVFSNLVLDDKGNVVFGLDFSVDPTFVDYKQVLQTESTSPSGT